jgi:hypothetical protein
MDSCAEEIDQHSKLEVGPQEPPYASTESMAVSIAELWQETGISTFIRDLAVWQVSIYPGSQRVYVFQRIGGGALWTARAARKCFDGAIARLFLPAAVGLALSKVTDKDTRILAVERSADE